MARRRVPVGSPRYQAAVRRTEAARAMRSEAGQQLMKENKIRAIVAQPPQTLGGETPRRKVKKPPFQR